ncbi:MAG TPA: hypothetical protein VMB50_10800 [Myxococcales bacterium]|nr:hypothetical protein [Myxococcales bacterium]
MNRSTAAAAFALVCGAASAALADALPPDACPSSYAAGQSCAGVALPSGQTGPACGVCTSQPWSANGPTGGRIPSSVLACLAPDGGSCPAGGGGCGQRGVALAPWLLALLVPFLLWRRRPA